MPQNPHETDIYEALAALSRRGVDDSFVIIEELKTKKYVQFGVGRCLIMDLPCVALTADEADRASQFFRALGSDAPKEYAANNPTTGRVDHGAAFYHDFGRDVKAATKAALDAFAEIYRMPADIALKVIEE